MSNIGYREIVDFGALSLKQLNDNLRALWGKVMGDIEYRDLSKDARSAIDSKAQSSDLAGYSTIEQTADAIDMAVGDLNLSQYSTVSQTAQAITAALADTSGVTQVSIRQGQGLRVEQSATRSYFQANAIACGFYDGAGRLLGGFDAAGRFATSILRNPESPSGYELRIGNIGDFGSGLEMLYAGSTVGGMYGSAGSLFIDAASAMDVIGGGNLHLQGGGAHLWLTHDARKGASAAGLRAHILPESDNAYDIGGDGMRWRRIYTNNTVNTSDLRLKRGVAPLEAADLLNRLKPIRYRLKSEGDDARLRFGLGAQDVAQALEGTDYADAALLVGDDPGQLGLCYTELIAVLVEGHQRQRAQIKALAARVEALEKAAGA